SVLDHGAYRRAFDARASALGADGVTVTGALSDEDLLGLLHAADALVFPSLVEGFGLVVLEALACGTPVVTSGRAPFIEYLEPGDASFVDPHDPHSIAAGMMRVLEPDVARALAARGPAVAARHTWAASARVHARPYHEYSIAKESERARDAVRRALAG
ncbi:MAG: glycosyltransferase, partial [Candidatus Eremiobacteraeota bacterium]|nr:glycosyltransferase [Candidatus Eremiobacteraeota bacterium]